MKKREKLIKMVKVSPTVHKWLRVESVKRGITIDEFIESLRKILTKKTS